MSQLITSTRRATEENAYRIPAISPAPISSLSSSSSTSSIQLNTLSTPVSPKAHVSTILPLSSTTPPVPSNRNRAPHTTTCCINRLSLRILYVLCYPFRCCIRSSSFLFFCCPSSSITCSCWSCLPRSRKLLYFLVGCAAILALLWLLPWADLLTHFLEWIARIGWVGNVLLILGFVIVSFPFVMGYMVLALGSGFLYGILLGTLTVAVGSTLGACIAFAFFRKVKCMSFSLAHICRCMTQTHMHVISVLTYHHTCHTILNTYHSY